MITRIEAALKECNGDKFANLARHYLAYRYDSVISSGFVVGKEKSKKGTPDNFMPLGDFYIYNEITTQEKKIFDKLKSDISDCFEQKDIPIEKIVKIILICNSEIPPKKYEELSLYKNTFSTSTKLELIGIDDLATRIFRDYPSLCKGLGIPIDTGQILELDGFIRNYEKSKFATKLSNTFFNREKEIEDGLKKLSENKILLISGPAGIGKTKFSLQLAELFKKEHSNFKIKIITSNSNLDIWDDLNIQLIKDNNYLLIVDDANKLKSNLEQLLNFIDKRECEGQIKLILTVRNYVKAEVEHLLKHFEIISLKEFDEKELATILQSPEYNIREYYVNRIFSISKGNPRIAIMAAEAGLNKEIEKLHNASQIYEEYFSSIKHSIDSFNDIDLLKVAGILSLLRYIDFDSKEVLGEIDFIFGIDSYLLLEKLQLLVKLEIADEFKNAYKIADQILGEYLFYTIFIKEQSIPFKKLLEVYVEKRSFPLTTILFPIISNYGFPEVKDLIQKDVKDTWEEIKSSSKTIHFLTDFWFYIQTEALQFLNSFKRNPIPDKFKTYDFTIYDSNRIGSYDDKRIDLLINFRQFPDQFPLALKIFNDYGLHNQENFSKYLKAYSQSFVYDNTSLDEKYKTQSLVLDFLYSKLEDTEELYSKFILFIAHKYLEVHFQSNSFRGNTIYMSSGPVRLIPEQKAIREKLWQFIFKCYLNENLKESVYSTIQQYISGLTFHNTNEEVISFDRDLLIPFIENNFSPNSYEDSAIVNQYVSKLKMLEIDVNSGIEEKYRSREYNLYLTLSNDKLKLKDFDSQRNHYEKQKEIELQNFIYGFAENDYLKLLEDINYLYSKEEKIIQGYRSIHESIITIFRYLFVYESDIFLNVFRKLLNYAYSTEIRFGVMLYQLSFDKQKANGLRAVLQSSPKGFKWLPIFWHHLPNNQFTKLDYELFRQILESDDFIDIWHLDNLLKKIDHLGYDKSKEINRFIDIIKFKLENGKSLHGDKAFFVYVFKEYSEVFTKRIRDIETIYKTFHKQDTYFDYDLDLLKIILTINPQFMSDLLKFTFSERDIIKRRELSVYNFDRIWNLENYEEIMTQILNFFLSSDRHYLYDDYLHQFFVHNDIKGIEFLFSHLTKSKDEEVWIKIYRIIITKYKYQKLKFLDALLDKGLHVEDFKRLDFWDQGMVFSGSEIPRIRERINELVQIQNHIQQKNNIDHLPFIEILENRILGEKSYMERIRKREFIETFGL